MKFLLCRWVSFLPGIFLFIGHISGLHNAVGNAVTFDSAFSNFQKKQSSHTARQSAGHRLGAQVDRQPREDAAASLWHAAQLVSCVHSPKIDTFPFRPSWLTWNIMTLPLTEKYSFIFTATKPPGDSCVPRTERRFLLLGPSRQYVLCLVSKSFFPL